MKKMLILIVAAVFCGALSAEEITGQTRFVPGVRLQIWTGQPLYKDLCKKDETFYQKGAAGGMIDRGKLFWAKTLKNSPSLQKYYEEPSVIGWSGYLKINKAGEHVLSFNPKIDLPGCYASGHIFFLNDKKYVTGQNDNVTSVSLDLEPGLYYFVLLMEHGPGRNGSADERCIIGSIKEPDALEARELTVKDFVVPAAWAGSVRR